MPNSFAANLANEHPAALAVASAGYAVRHVEGVGDVWYVYIDWPQYRGHPVADISGKLWENVPGFTGLTGTDERGKFIVVRSLI